MMIRLDCVLMSCTYLPAFVSELPRLPNEHISQHSCFMLNRIMTLFSTSCGFYSCGWALVQHIEVAGIPFALAFSQAKWNGAFFPLNLKAVKTHIFAGVPKKIIIKI